MLCQFCYNDATTPEGRCPDCHDLEARIAAQPIAASAIMEHLGIDKYRQVLLRIANILDEELWGSE